MLSRGQIALTARLVSWASARGLTLRWNASVLCADTSGGCSLLSASFPAAFWRRYEALDDSAQARVLETVCVRLDQELEPEWSASEPKALNFDVGMFTAQS